MCCRCSRVLSIWHSISRVYLEGGRTLSQVTDIEALISDKFLPSFPYPVRGRSNGTWICVPSHRPATAKVALGESCKET